MTSEYAARGYVVHRKLLSPGLTSLLADQLWMSRIADKARSGDTQVPLSYSLYGGPVFQTLLCRLAPNISRVIGLTCPSSNALGRSTAWLNGGSGSLMV